MLKRLLLPSFVAVSLLVLQCVSVVHAAEHAFHDHELECELLIAIEKQDNATEVASPELHAAALLSLESGVQPPVWIESTPYRYRSRAPPSV